MTLEYILLALSWAISIALLLIFIPRNKVREAHVVFFFKQLLTWLFGLVIAEYDLIEYPVRIFKSATTASFTFEYFVYPAICALFNINYPENRVWLKKALHYFYYTSGITAIEMILEKYTLLIDYVNWTWFWTWLTLLATFLLSRLYYTWFFRKKAML